MIRLGNKLLPVVIPLLVKIGNALADAFGWFDKLGEGTQEWIVKLGLAFAALGPILSILGKILTLQKVIAGTQIFEAAGAGAAAAGAKSGGGFVSGVKGALLTAGATLGRTARLGVGVLLVRPPEIGGDLEDAAPNRHISGQLGHE